MTFPVAITGLGIVAAPGRGLAAQRTALRHGQSWIRKAPRADLPLAATLPIAAVTTELPPVPGRSAQLALAAAQDACLSAGLSGHHLRQCGIITGTCTGGLPESEAAFLTNPVQAWPQYRRQPSHRLTHIVAHALGCAGPRSTHSVACASSALALTEACEWIRQGVVTAVLVIGADALTRVTMAGFHSLMLVDPNGTRPFTTERQGLSLGEGAAAFIVEHPEAARQRGAPILASLCGWGHRTDGYHSTSPDPSGAHLHRAITDCLSDAHITAADISYINAHGTGTVDNDLNEAAVLRRLFPRTPAASNKRTYGHTLGAAAAIEGVASCLAIQDQCHWQSAGNDLGTPMADLNVVSRTTSAATNYVLSTTLAFGGVNVALCFGPAAACQQVG